MNERLKNKEFKDYCARHIEEDCEEDVIEMTILTGFNVKGAGKSSNDLYYSSYVSAIAYIDNNNKLIKEKISFMYYLNNDEKLKYFDIENLKAYKVKCKKFKYKNLYYLLKVKKVTEKRFAEIVEEQSKPITLTVNDVLFTYDRRFSEYRGSDNLEGKKINIILGCERNSVNAEKSIETYKKIFSNFKNFYKEVLKNCAKNIVALANVWKSDDTPLITAEEIEKRINGDNLEIEISDKDFTIYFDDDDLFLGHSIVYNGNIENDEFSVDIAG